jgi:hypothetical protein
MRYGRRCSALVMNESDDEEMYHIFNNRDIESKTTLSPKFNDYCIPAPYGNDMAQLQEHTPIPSTRSSPLVPRQPLTATIPDPFDYVSLLEELKTYR